MSELTSLPLKVTSGKQTKLSTTSSSLLGWQQAPTLKKTKPSSDPLINIHPTTKLKKKKKKKKVRYINQSSNDTELERGT